MPFIVGTVALILILVVETPSTTVPLQRLTVTNKSDLTFKDRRLLFVERLFKRVSLHSLTDDFDDRLESTV
jgi:hypothetical protein